MKKYNYKCMGNNNSTQTEYGYSSIQNKCNAETVCDNLGTKSDNVDNKKKIVHNSLNSNPVKIITGMVTSKGGLKRFGFNNI